MTAREWRAGDVVTATVNGRPNVRLVAGWSKFNPQLRWCELSPRWADGDDDECWFMPFQVTDHRPLLVIDPRDRDQLEAVITALGKASLACMDGLSCQSLTCVADMVRDALLSLIPPALVPAPKVDEPAGRYAVVLDRAGEEWIRDGLERDGCCAGTWWNVDRALQASPDMWRADWADVDAVEVLFAGLPPKVDQ